jgi:hypothetical protein
MHAGPVVTAVALHFASMLIGAAVVIAVFLFIAGLIECFGSKPPPPSQKH